MGIFGSKKQQFSEETLRSSVFMTFAQALNVAKQTPAGWAVPSYSKLFSAIVSKCYKDGLITEETFRYIKYSPFEIEINKEDFDLFKLAESDGMKYLQQGLALNKALSRWNTSMSVSNNDQMEIFTTLALVCEQLGMDKNDEESMGLLFIVSIFYTTVLKDSQKDRVHCERWRSLGNFFATEFPNRWLIEKSKS